MTTLDRSSVPKPAADQAREKFSKCRPSGRAKPVSGAPMRLGAASSREANGTSTAAMNNASTTGAASRPVTALVVEVGEIVEVGEVTAPPWTAG